LVDTIYRDIEDAAEDAGTTVTKGDKVGNGLWKDTARED
jgi:hypothetical protein